MTTLLLKTLVEHVPTSYGRDEIPDSLGELLWQRFSDKVTVEFPSPKTDMRWRLTSEGWVGYLPVSSTFVLQIEPKVQLHNLFRMLEYAYDLRGFHVFPGSVDCQSIREFYERLAAVLARRVLDRLRKGCHRAYSPRVEFLPFVRGRLRLEDIVRKPWTVNLGCQYEDFTTDIVDNRILAWTLRQVSQSGLCTDRVLPTVRRAYRAIQQLVTLEPIRPDDCQGLLYHRLNEDYEPLHGLCRFFLENSGPGHPAGDHRMLPFLVNMPSLFERFVAKWLHSHLPTSATAQAQETVRVGQSGALEFRIDITLYDATTCVPSCVIDTKYKVSDIPTNDDVAQVVVYAELKGCRDAFLVYPAPLQTPIDEQIGNIRVRSLAFSLGQDLDQAGREFLKHLPL